MNNKLYLSDGIHSAIFLFDEICEIYPNGSVTVIGPTFFEGDDYCRKWKPMIERKLFRRPYGMFPTWVDYRGLRYEREPGIAMLREMLETEKALENLE